MNNAQLVLENVSKSINGKFILKNINLKLKQGTKLSILGPSGSGKTTLLRIIAGLDSFDCGNIFFNEKSLSDIPVYKRNFGMMFQDLALFPHLNVFDNISFSLKMKKASLKEIKKQVDKMLVLTNLTGFKTRKIDELSGGEKQRVALARTLATNPDILMLDEPLSSLDRMLRKRLLDKLVKIISKINITTIFVSHDHKEAFKAGDIVVIMNNGTIVQENTQNKLMANPCNEWVKKFLDLN